MRGGVRIPPSPFPFLKAILAYFKKPACPALPARGLIGRAARPSILAWPGPARAGSGASYLRPGLLVGDP